MKKPEGTGARLKLLLILTPECFHPKTRPVLRLPFAGQGVKFSWVKLITIQAHITFLWVSRANHEEEPANAVHSQRELAAFYDKRNAALPVLTASLAERPLGWRGSEEGCYEGFVSKNQT